MQLHRPLAACLIAVYLSLLWREVMGPPHVTAQVDCTVTLAGAAAGAERCPEAAPRPDPAVNVIDVAAGAATPTLISQLLRLSADERVASVDDRPVENNFIAGAWIAARFEPGRAPARGDHLDLTIRGAYHSRRVLVLFH